MKRRRARTVLVLLGIALVGVAVTGGESLYWFVMTKRVPYEADLGSGTERKPVRGWLSVHRWIEHETPGMPHGEVTAWFVEAGFIAIRGVVRDGAAMTLTEWSKDGSVLQQRAWTEDRLLEKRTEPPWLWGETDQTEPSIPAWMQDDDLWNAETEGQ